MITQNSQNSSQSVNQRDSQDISAKPEKDLREIDMKSALLTKSEHCGSRELSDIIGYSKSRVACLVDRPIEVVQYQRAKCQYNECGAIVIGSASPGIVPGQDLSIDLQALLVWLGKPSLIPQSQT